ncbi:MAG: hypothetical protein EA362_08565 [Saprospirales bacterium]|nr:MAG: hypothetical protein EA362_08565 [Saprospirales bacterium]
MTEFIEPTRPQAAYNRLSGRDDQKRFFFECALAFMQVYLFKVGWVGWFFLCNLIVVGNKLRLQVIHDLSCFQEQIYYDYF